MGKSLKDNKMNSGRQMTRIKQMSVDFFNGLSMVIRPVCVIHILWLAPLLLALSTVFVISNDLANGAVSGKYFWFYSSMGLVSFVTLIKALTNRCLFRFSMADLFVFLFAAAVYLPPCLFDNVALNATKLAILALLVVLYFSIRLVINTFNREDIARHILYISIILIGVVEAVWGLRQLYGFESSQHSLFKLTGSFFNPGPYAGYLAMVFPMALHYWVQGKGYAPLRVFAGITCIVLLLVVPAAMSRASWIAAIAGSGIVIYARYSDLVRKFYQRQKKTVWISGCVIVLLVSTASVGMYFLKRDSADGRLLTWKISLQTIAKHPFGVSIGNFPSAYGEEQAVYFASGNASKTEEYVAGNPEYGFNEYLQIAVESGIIALLLFAGIIVLSIRDKIKTKDWGGLGSLVALLVFAGFSYPFSVLPFLIIFVLLLATGQRNVDDARPVNTFRLYSVALALLFLPVTGFCLWKQYPAYQAYKQWKANQVYYHAGLYRDTSESYEAFYPYLNDQIRFLFEYAQSLSKSGQPEKSNAILQRAMQISCDPMLYNIMGKNYQTMKQYKQAEAVYIKSTQLSPSRLYPWYLLTKLYAEMGWDEKAAETAKIVLTKEPKVQSPAVREMREEIKKLRTEN
jgi:tetratricopeptide (TPR) repeat protein